MPETEPTPVTELPKSYLAWRISRYLAIQGLKRLLRLTWWLIVPDGQDSRRIWEAVVIPYTQLRQSCQAERVRLVHLAKIGNRSRLTG